MPLPQSTDPLPQQPSFADFRNGSIAAPAHSWLTSPARLHPNAGDANGLTAQAKELPLHLILLILTHIDHAGDLARLTRTSRLFYYMTLPRLYEHVTLRSYSELRIVNGLPEGYGGGSPFAMGLNTLVSRSFTDYIQSFRLTGEWREHDAGEYQQGRVPDNSMMLQIVIRAVLDKMKNLTAFAWELDTPPLSTVFQGLISNTALASLTIRCQKSRTPRPTTAIPPLPNLITLVVYDIDPLCYPDDISLLMLGSKKLENLKLHWSPRMRNSGEESTSLFSIFGRCLAAKYMMRVKRLAMYNLFTRMSHDGFDNVMNHATHMEVTVINSFGSSDPKTVFSDNSWTLHYHHPVPVNLKMYRTDYFDKAGAAMFARFNGLERLYLIGSQRRIKPISTPDSITPTTPSPSATSGPPNGATPMNCAVPITSLQCRDMGSDYLAAIQTHHPTMRHLLLSDHWQLSDNTLLKICQSLPLLEQLGFACIIPPFHILRQVVVAVPNLWALRMLVRPGSEFDEKLDSVGDEMHMFAMATELWRPEYKNLKYVGIGDKRVWKLGAVHYPRKLPAGDKKAIPEGQENSMNARRAGPIRRLEPLTWEDVKHIEIWGMDTVEFDPKFP